MWKKRLNQDFIRQLKTMGWALIGLAAAFTLLAYLTPTNETSYWFSSRNKEGIYAISSLFVFLGIYCLGAVWRRKYFI